MRDHLDYCSVHGCLVHHQHGKKHKSAVAHGGVSINIFKIFLGNCSKSSINDTDRSKYNKYPGKFMSCLRHEENSYPECPITSFIRTPACSIETAVGAEACPSGDHV